jgi:hypothetical protein
LLLTILPLIVIAIVDLFMGRGWYRVIQSPDWAFGSSVLFGQIIFKLVACVIKGRAEVKNWEKVGLTVVIVLVFGLVPSLVGLSLRLTIEDPSISLVVFQSALFVLSSACFLFFGSIAHYGLFLSQENH